MSEQQHTFSGPPEPDADEETRLAVVRTRLYLSWLRSTGIVQRALADRFPDEGAWIDFLRDATVATDIARFQEVVTAIRVLAASGRPADLAALEEAGGAYYEEGLAALVTTAALIGVAPDDLLVTLVHA